MSSSSRIFSIPISSRRAFRSASSPSKYRGSSACRRLPPPCGVDGRVEMCSWGQPSRVRPSAAKRVSVGSATNLYLRERDESRKSESEREEGIEDKKRQREGGMEGISHQNSIRGVVSVPWKGSWNMSLLSACRVCSSSIALRTFGFGGKRKPSKPW